MRLTLLVATVLTWLVARWFVFGSWRATGDVLVMLYVVAFFCASKERTGPMKQKLKVAAVCVGLGLYVAWPMLEIVLPVLFG